MSYFIVTVTVPLPLFVQFVIDELEVVTSTVCRASIGGIMAVSRPVRWLLSTPSICTLLAIRDWPLTRVESESWALKNSECGRKARTVPGTRFRRLWKLRV